MKPEPNQLRAVLLCILVLGMVLVALEPGGFAQEQGSGWGTQQVDEDNLPIGSNGRHFRVLVEVDATGMEGVRDLPVQKVLDLAAVLTEHAAYPSQTGSGGRTTLSGFELDLDSFLVQEVDQEGVPVEGNEYLPVIVEEGSVEGDGSFHAVREPTVTVRWIMPEETTATRYFHVYFDSTHNNPGPGPTLTPNEEMALITSVGPGRGTTLFVPLYSLPLPQGNDEARRVHVTALYDDTDVDAFEYSAQGFPLAVPAQQVSGLQAGETFEYILGDNGNDASVGTVKVEANRPVIAEALSIHRNDRGAFTPNDFIPSADGGFLGSLFRATPSLQGPGETWHVYCPTLAATNGDCRVSQNEDGSAAVAITQDTVRTITLNAGQISLLRTTDGSSVLVQRVGSGLTYWPAVNGPQAATQFIGHAGSSDWFVATAPTPACLLVYSMGADQFLSRTPGHLDQWCPPVLPGTITSTMDRSWPTGHAHQEGGLRLEARTGTGLSFTSGSSPSESNLVVPQSTDGGRTYQIFVPTGSAGNPLGQVVVFPLYEGTSINATRHTGGSETLPALQAGQRHNLNVGPGWWTIQADRPIVTAWLRDATEPFGAYAPGFTDAAEVNVLEADYAGYAFDVSTDGSSFVQREPGDLVQFTMRVANRAQDVTGTELSDTAHVAMRTPSGWPEAQFDRPSRSLGPGEEATFTASVLIPETVEAGSGVTLRAQITSGENPDLVVERSLQVNFIIRRGVEVTEATGNRERTIDDGETAQYEIHVFNRGSASDAFDLQFTCAPDDRWKQTVTPMFDVFDANGEPLDPEDMEACEQGLRTPSIGPGGHATVFVDMTALAADLASRATTRVIATSLGDRSVTDSERLSTIVGVERNFRVLVDKPTRTVEPGGQTTFVLTIENQAEVNEELFIEIHSSLPDGWEHAQVRWVEEDTTLEAVNNTIPIAREGNVTLTLTRSVPEDAPALSLALDRVRMHSQFDSEAPESDMALRVLVATMRGIQANVDGPTHAVDPADETRFILGLESTGNVNQTVTVRPILPEGDWSVTDIDGAPPPWRVRVPPFGTTEFSVLVSPDPTTPPGMDAGRVDFEITGTGFTAQKAGVSFEVDERQAVDMEGATIRLDPGRLIEIPARLQNTGNLAFQVHGVWDGLPEWDVAQEPVALEPGASGVLMTWLKVPSEVAREDDFTATLHVMQGENVLSSADWVFTVNAPRLEAVIEEIRVISDDQARYRVRITNTGEDSARNVSVFLDHEREGTLDNFLILQILPDATATANLLGPTDPDGIAVRVIADHDPNGLRITPAQIEEPGRDLPGPGVLLILMILGVLAGLVGIARRWSR